MSVPRCPGDGSCRFARGAAASAAGEGAADIRVVPTAAGDVDVADPTESGPRSFKPTRSAPRSSRPTRCARRSSKPTYGRPPGEPESAPTRTPAANIEKGIENSVDNRVEISVEISIAQRDTSRRSRTVFRRRIEFQFCDFVHVPRTNAPRRLMRVTGRRRSLPRVARKRGTGISRILWASAAAGTPTPAPATETASWVRSSAGNEPSGSLSSSVAPAAVSVLSTDRSARGRANIRPARAEMTSLFRTEGCRRQHSVCLAELESAYLTHILPIRHVAR